MIRENLENKLRDAFSPTELTVTDESNKHIGHAGWRPEGETHFHVRIVSDSFEGQSRVARQRAVYALLSDEFDAGLHALSLDLKTPEEAGKNA